MLPSLSIRSHQGLRPAAIKHSNFVIAHLNVRSLYPKLDMVNQLITVNAIDILCVNETWLNPDISDSLIDRKSVV